MKYLRYTRNVTEEKGARFNEPLFFCQGNALSVFPRPDFHCEAAITIENPCLPPEVLRKR